MIRTIHIDIEGGWGGSSRSLFELVSRLDRERVAPLIVHRSEGPLQDWYREIGIPTLHVPEIGSYVPRETKAAKNLLATMPRLLRLGRATDLIAAAARGHEANLVHLNYEGLFVMAPKLKRRLGLPTIGHCRAHLPESAWGRWLARRLSRAVDQMFYISPMEETRFRCLAGAEVPPGEVLWNIARPAPPRGAFEDPPRVVYFGNIDHSKGADRMIDIAAALDAMDAPPMRLMVYGIARSSAAYAEGLTERVEREGLGHRIEFPGFERDPAGRMSTALALVRPSRGRDPWGRDVIEAAAAGLPVVATGTFDGVVMPGETGWLVDPFDAETVAPRLVALLEEPGLFERTSDAAAARARTLFGGAAQAARFEAVATALVRDAA